MRRMGRYEIGRVLGEGGVGRIYEAVLHGPGGFRKSVALKVLHEGGDDLQREARIGGLLRHRNLVDVYEIGCEDDTWFCAMELCDGGSLAQHAPLPPRAVVEVGLAVCRALAYAHRDLGLLHLDIKPQNLLLAGDVVKVADLGIARARGFDVWRGVRGTPGYMPPEQAFGGEVDARSDIYALGVTLLALAGGDTATTSATVDWASLDTDTRGTAETQDLSESGAGAEQDSAGGVPGWLAPAVERCLAPDPEDRWPDMEQLAEALRTLAVEGPGLREVVGATGARPALRPDSNVSTGSDDFVGRRDELRRVGKVLAGGGCITVKGPGGVGKSRLAAVAVQRWREECSGETWRCDLTESRSLEQSLAALARVLDVPLQRGDPVDQIGEAIAARGPVAILLDNGSAVSGVAAAVEAWLEHAPQARFVITSRTPLGLATEHVMELDVLPQEDAVALLCARALERGVELDDADAVGELADRLDGLPLAIELAAGRLGVLSVRDVLDRLELSLLRRGTDDRHGTLQAALDWSWELLGPVERTALAQLSVFAGGFRLDAAEAVLELPGATGVFDVIETLLDRSWLTARQGRFRMLDTIRAYAAERFDDREPVEERHGRWFAALGSLETVRRLGGTGSASLRRRLRDEADNLELACRRAVERGDGEVAVGAGRALWSVLRIDGSYPAALELFRAVEGMELEPRVQARASHLLSLVLLDVGTVEETMAHASKARSAARSLGDAQLALDASVLLCSLHRRRGEMELAEERAREVVEGAPRHSASWCRGMEQRSMLAFERGDLEGARRGYAEVLEVARARGYVSVVSNALTWLAHIHQERGELDQAEPMRVEALALRRAADSQRAEVYALVNLAILHHTRGERDEARRHYDEAATLAASIGARPAAALALFNRGCLAAEEGRWEAAWSDLRAALDHYTVLGDKRWIGLALGYIGLMHLLRGELGDAETRAREALDLHEAVRDPASAAVDRALLGRVALARGELGKAREWLESAASDLASRSALEHGIALAYLGDALARLGDGDARATADEAVRIHREADHRRELAEALVLRAAHADEPSGDLDEAEAILGELGLPPGAPDWLALRRASVASKG